MKQTQPCQISYLNQPLFSITGPHPRKIEGIIDRHYGIANRSRCRVQMGNVTLIDAKQIWAGRRNVDPAWWNVTQGNVPEH